MPRTLDRTGRTMAASKPGTQQLALPGATPERGPIERDATTDGLVAQLRAVAADLRRGKNDRRKERGRRTHAATGEEAAPAPETRRDWLARGLKFWCL
jgi:hypothetical protein